MDGVHLLALSWGLASDVARSRDFSRSELSIWGWAYAYQSVFVGGFLPLLGHSTGLGTGEVVDGEEDGDGGSNELSDLTDDTQTLTLGGLGTGTVGTEGNVVSCDDGRYVSGNRSIVERSSNWR